MAGRGGRGLALLEALKKQKEEQPGGTAPEEPPSVSTCPLPGGAVSVTWPSFQASIRITIA